MASLDAPQNRPLPVFTSSPAQRSVASDPHRYHSSIWRPLTVILGGALFFAVLSQRVCSAQTPAGEPPAAEVSPADTETVAAAEEIPDKDQTPSATKDPASAEVLATTELTTGVERSTGVEDAAAQTADAQHSHDHTLPPADDVRDDPEELKKALSKLPDDIREDAQAAWNQFVETGKTLASAMLALRSDQLRYRNGFDQSPEAAVRYGEQRTRTWKLMQSQFTNAVALIQYLPSVEAVRYVATMVQYHFEHDIYDAETYEGAARLLDFGQNLEFMFLAAARSAVVSGQFEAAKKIYDVLENERLKDVDLRLKFQLEILEKQYEEEQAAINSTDADKLPHVRFKTTQGDVVIELFPDAAPSAVAHFRKLVKEGFYDGMDFSLVSQSLLAMTGDNTNDGRGNTGQFLIDEHGGEKSRHGLRGSVVMAKLPLGNGAFIEHSGSSQIAILYLPISAISSAQSVIGRVIEGMDIVSKLRRIDPTEKKEQNEIQLPPDVVVKAEIVRFGEDLPDPKYVDMQAEIEKAVKAGMLKPKKVDAAPE